MSEEKKQQQENEEKQEHVEKYETKHEQEQEQKEEKQEENVEQLKARIKELEEKLKKTEEQAKKLSALYQSLQQDFDRFRVRTQKEKEEAKDEGLLKIAKGLLEIVDNFEKALESAKVSNDVSALSQGIQMIHYQLVRFLQEHGIEEINAEGEFNPNEHEVLDTCVSEEHEVNQIVKVLQKGYKYKGKVIRPAKVVVAIEKPKEE